MYVVREAADKDGNNIEARTCVARIMVKDAKSSFFEKKSKNEQSKNRSTARIPSSSPVLEKGTQNYDTIPQRFRQSDTYRESQLAAG